MPNKRIGKKIKPGIVKGGFLSDKCLIYLGANFSQKLVENHVPTGGAKGSPLCSLAISDPPRRFLDMHPYY